MSIHPLYQVVGQQIEAVRERSAPYARTIIEIVLADGRIVELYAADTISVAVHAPAPAHASASSGADQDHASTSGVASATAPECGDPDASGAAPDDDALCDEDGEDAEDDVEDDDDELAAVIARWEHRVSALRAADGTIVEGELSAALEQFLDAINTDSWALRRAFEMEDKAPGRVRLAVAGCLLRCHDDIVELCEMMNILAHRYRHLTFLPYPWDRNDPMRMWSTQPDLLLEEITDVRALSREFASMRNGVGRNIDDYLTTDRLLFSLRRRSTRERLATVEVEYPSFRITEAAGEDGTEVSEEAWAWLLAGLPRS